MHEDSRMSRMHFIGGQPHAPATGEILQERNPRTRTVSYEIGRGNAADVDAAVQSAVAAWPAWRDRRPIERGRVLMAVAAMLRARKSEFAAIEMRETGRSQARAHAEIEVAAQYFEFYGGLVNVAEGDVISLGANYHAYTRREPFGAVGIIVPWNGPLNQAARGIAPALAVGNVAVAKPSEFTSMTLLEMARLACEECGLPAGVLNVVTGLGPEAGMAIAGHRLIRKIAFTGSVRAGRELGRVAAERIIPVSLELGGKSPNIVFADADLDQAVDGTIRAFTSNTGQVCSAGTRCLVERSIHERFLALLKERLALVKVGASDDAGLGPIITEAQFERVGHYAELAAREGELFIGGRVLDEAEFAQGWYVRPMIVSGLQPDARILREEVFGPLAAVLAFDDEAEAVRIANDTDYGLAAGLWTCSLQRAHRVAAALEAGQVFVNEYFAGGVETPFGGYKQSGHGREKGIEALHHYTQTKSVMIRL
jgi:aldehyde dehydrogenase (NAD+)